MDFEFGYAEGSKTQSGAPDQDNYFSGDEIVLDFLIGFDRLSRLEK